jgi:hypothetical protein
LSRSNRLFDCCRRAFDESSQWLTYGLTASSFSELPILWEEQLQIAS